jgi:type IV pilus assembly protein PilV
MKIHALAPVRRSAVLRRGRSAGGFTLLEVLVAIVVLSFGVLGVVGLQAAALQANKEARYQSTAVAMGRELGDLMRGNKDVAITAGNPYLGSWASTATLPTAPSCTPCASATDVAQANMADWLMRVRDALPGVRVEVCFDADAYGGTAAALPKWGCTDTGGLAVVKMGWTRQSTNRNDADPEQAVRPVVVVPLIAGSAT